MDTDLGGDTDDACALAMLLGWPDVEITAVTTSLDPGGRRAGMVGELLERAHAGRIPVAAGAGSTLTTRETHLPKVDDVRYWGRTIASRPAAPGAALERLAESIRDGATVLVIGPWTNLALLEITAPGVLADADVVAMGGWLQPPAPGLPPWGPEMDWNVQCDAEAALIVAKTARLTLATLPVAMTAHLTERDLDPLRRIGHLGELLAAQSVANAQDMGMAKLCAQHPALPDDLLNFQWDPVAAATAVGWPGTSVRTMSVRPELTDGTLHFRAHAAGRAMRVLTALDAPAFREAWLEAVARAQQRAGP